MMIDLKAVQAMLNHIGIRFCNISCKESTLRIHLYSKEDAQTVGRHLRDAKYQEITIRPAIEGFLLDADQPKE